MRGVLRAALGEALGGFAANRFPSEYKSSIKALHQKIDLNSSTSLSSAEAALSVMALGFALDELGQEEFFTITGYDFDFGAETLQRIKSMISESKVEN